MPTYTDANQNDPKGPRRGSLSGQRFRFARTAIVTAALWTSLACAAAAPALQQFATPTSTPESRQSWSIAQIAKPSTTPLATSAAPTVTAEAVVPEIEPSPTDLPPASLAEESPLITMEIVEDDTQPVISQEVAPPTTSGGKYILVSISEQHLYAYENGQLVYSFVASTGVGNSTRVGTFQVLDKIPNAYGANWNIWMPNWMGIYWSGSLENGIHALPILPGGGRLWAGFLGTPISYGCVVLGVDESLQLYDWAEVGTPVEIRW
jgi:lipoprotein-anchoring transpeptidase ErfK/SrfK